MSPILAVIVLDESWHGGCFNVFQDQPGRRGVGLAILGEGASLGTTGLFLLKEQAVSKNAI